MSTLQTTQGLLSKAYAPAHVGAAIRHYQVMIECFRQQAWEPAITKGGKFVEAVLKALWVSCGQPLPPSRQFKAGNVIDQLPQKTKDEVIGLLIPRACRFAHEIASNRDGRHDSHEISANQMDATVVVAVCSWILSEMVRHSQAGNMASDEARRLVEELSEKRFPLVEEIDGRVYFNLRNPSARDVGLLTMWAMHPRRVSIDELKASIIRHHHRAANANVAVARLSSVVDDDGQGRLRLRAPGLQEAEEIISRAASNGLKGEKA